MEKIKKKIEVELEIPDVPNYIRYGDRKLLPISAFSEEELREVAEEWTKELLKKRNKRIIDEIA